MDSNSDKDATNKSISTNNIRNNNTAKNNTTSHNTHNTQTHQTDTPVPNHDTNSDFGYAPYYTAHAKLAAIVMNTVRTVYAGKDTTTTLFTKVQQRVRELKAWVDDLPACLHMDKGMNNPPSAYYHDYDLLSLHLNLNQVRLFAVSVYIPSFFSFTPRYKQPVHLLAHSLGHSLWTPFLLTYSIFFYNTNPIPSSL